MTDGDDEHRARSVRMWREVMHMDAPPITDAFVELTTDHVFGTIWTRPGLGHRDRRLITLTVTAMVAQREALGTHLRAALESGDLSADELQEWVVHLAHYGGWPVAAGAYTALREAQARLDPPT